MRIGSSCSNLDWNLLAGEDPEELLHVRERPFDRTCLDLVSLNSRQLATLCEACHHWYGWRRWKQGPPPMAYDLLERGFERITGLTGDTLPAYTIQDIIYAINNALREAGIPRGLLEPQYRQHPWYLRQELLGKPEILKHFHAQERDFLQHKQEHDKNPNAQDKDDPWIYFRDYQKWPFVPDRDLQAAYLVLGRALDFCTTLSFRFQPTDLHSLYPKFFGSEPIKQANGNEYVTRLNLTPIQEGAFFETLWKHIEMDLADHGLLEQPEAQNGGEKIDVSNQDLTYTETNILEALGDETLRGKELLKLAGYDYSSHYRQILSNLKKRGILASNDDGYYRT